MVLTKKYNLSYHCERNLTPIKMLKKKKRNLTCFTHLLYLTGSVFEFATHFLRFFPSFIHSTNSSQAITMNQKLTDVEATGGNKIESLLSGSVHVSGQRQTKYK